MRTSSIVKGGSIVALIGVAGVLALPSSTSKAMSVTSTDRLSLTGHIRDFPPNSHHVDFQVNPSATPGARSAKNIGTELNSEHRPVFVGGGRRINNEWRDGQARKIAWRQHDAPMGLPDDNPGNFSGNDNGGISSASSFDEWFRDVPGVNMSRLWTINLDRQPDGSFLYDTSNFNPIDNQLFGNGLDEHNFYFTYEIVCTFTAAPGQWLEFKGDDDCWMFIDNRLALDHGGIAANREQRVDFNRYGLTAGQEYEMRFFFAERCQPQSQFRLHTNIEFQTVNDGSIFAVYD